MLGTKCKFSGSYYKTQVILILLFGPPDLSLNPPLSANQLFFLGFASQEKLTVLYVCYCRRVVPKNSLKHNRIYVLNNITQMLQVSKNSNIKINYASQHL